MNFGSQSTLYYRGMGLFSHDKGGDILAFDVSDAGVGLLSTSTLTERNPTTMYMQVDKSVSATENEKDSFKETLASVERKLKDLSKKYKEKHHGLPSRMYCFLHSPWVVGHTRTIVYKKDEEFVFTNELKQKLLDQDFEDLKKTGFGDGSSNSLYEHTFIIERKVISIELNGYQTSSYEGRKVKEVQIRVYVSVGEKQVIETIEKAIKEYFHVSKIKFRSFLFASYSATTLLNPEKKSYILVNIENESTEISIVHDSILSDSRAFTAGSNLVIESLATFHRMAKEEIRSLMKLYGDDTHDPKALAPYEETFNKARGEWVGSLAKGLFILAQGASLPSTVVVTAEGDLTGWFKDAVTKEEFTQHLLTDRKFDVILLSNPSFSAFFDIPGRSLNDAFLLIDSLYIHTRI